jgi:hypothetical protein
MTPARREGHRRAFLAEVEEHDGPERWLTGRFRCAADDELGPELALEEALAWARSRARRIQLRLGEGEPYSAGSDPVPGLPAWPPDDLPPLVRRRPSDERWRDRTDADPPIAWRVEATLRPPGDAVPEREAVRTVVAAAAERAGADSWDSDALDQLRADVDQARREAGGAEEFGWTSYGAPEGRAVFTVVASTPAAAEADVARRVQAPAGWRVRCAAVPANAESTRSSSSA